MEEVPNPPEAIEEDERESGRGSQVRNICFTINRGEREEDELLLLDFNHPTWHHVKFCIYQREMGEHEHFQGYMEFTQPKAYSAIHRMDGMERAHFEKRYGTAKQAAHYCMKPVEGCDCQHCRSEAESPTKIEGPWSFGEMSQQGQRADVLEIKRAIDRGVSLKRIACDEDMFPTWIKMPKNFETYKRLSTQPRRRKPVVILFIGPSGTGKTRTACNIARQIGPYFLVPPKHSGFWCDDYGQEPVFIIDEMDGHRMSPTFFNQLVDWEPMNVPCHGTAGHQFTSPYVFITTNYHPKFWWRKRSPDQVKQTMRRIDVILKFFPPKPVYEHIGWQMFGNNINRSDEVPKDKDEL